MRVRSYLYLAVLVLAACPLAAAQNRYILRPSPTIITSLTDLEQRYDLTAVEPLDSHNEVYLVTAPSTIPVQQVETEVRADPEAVDIEPDQTVDVPELDQSTEAILDSLPAPTAVNYYGANVLGAYLSQPAASLIRIADAQNNFEVTGAGIVAIIDTGIDPYHPALANSIIPGYDFVHNIAGSASEWVDLTPDNLSALGNSSSSVTSKSVVAKVNQSTEAILDQSTAAILDIPNLPKAFGHGTMVAGIVHLVAPTAEIMPLKAFRADGTANLSDILRAIYYAVDNDANVINMSFSLASPSDELEDAIDYAQANEVICVASAGNTGTAFVSMPASLQYVMGVASTSNSDVLSKFSSYGPGVFVAAPGEGVITTYPGQNYAEATGTSFSSPFVAGAAAILIQVEDSLAYSGASQAVSHAKKLTPNLGNGLLDVYQAVQSIAGEGDSGEN